MKLMAKQKALRLQTYGFPSTFRGPKIRLLLVNKADYLSKGDFRSRSELMAGTRTRTRREIKWISNGDCNPGNATRESKNPFAPWIDPLSRENSHFLRAKAMKPLERGKPFVFSSKQFQICQLISFYKNKILFFEDFLISNNNRASFT